MASISVSKDDFGVLMDAANEAQRRGDTDAAQALDKLARKANAALTNSGSYLRRFAGAPTVAGIKWTEVPSSLL